ncbi:unnamed protein product [Brugia pahangi]|uniref:Cadherin domain-containing protein n=1 Tax=Brugia pahangi TaxID=6280 RepID=A0A0N4TB65_BRUPA|nr:unnamed protein product [Brugia pahangi]
MFRPLDYEDPIQRDGFTLGIRVYDGRYYATTKLYIELQDRNDNPPVINGPQYVQLHEDAWLGKEVAKFTVQDADENDTAHMYNVRSQMRHHLNDHCVNVISKSSKISNNSILWCLLAILFTSVVVVVDGQELSQLFLGSYPSQSRFLNFAGKSQRDIVVRLTKNLTEDTPVGTLIATFRAEDKDSMTHNLT